MGKEFCVICRDCQGESSPPEIIIAESPAKAVEAALCKFKPKAEYAMQHYDVYDDAARANPDTPPYAVSAEINDARHYVEFVAVFDGDSVRWAPFEPISQKDRGKKDGKPLTFNG